MFFTLSKLAWAVLQPSAALLILAAAGLALGFTRFQRTARGFLICGIAGLVIISFSPLGRIMMGTLEDRVPKAAVMAPPGGIIVLGGAVHMEVSAARGEAALLSGAERIVAGYELAMRFPGVPVLLSGGDNALFGADDTIASEAAIMKDLLVSFGVPQERIILEGASRNTWENAVNSLRLAETDSERPWLLVTSAYHMPRALGAFRKAGFDVLPYPVDYQTRGRQDRANFFYYSSDGISFTDFAAKEWLGLAAYYLTGKTDALFPAPAP